MNNHDHELRLLSRERVRLILEMAQADVALDDETRQLADVLEQHPEYHHVFAEAGAEDVTIDGVNPFLHVTMHQVVENQIADNDPTQTAETLDALLTAGCDRHEAIHAIAAIVVEEIYEALKSRREYDRAAYVAALRELERTAITRRKRGRRSGRGRRRGGR